MHDYDDIELLSDFHQGLKKAYDELYEKYFTSMYLVSYSFVKDEGKAQDIVIKVLSKFFSMDRMNFDSLPRITSFLNVSVRNASMNEVKSKERINKHIRSINDNDSEIECVNDEIDFLFIKKIYNSCLNVLPPQTLKVIKLLYEENLSYKEIADQLKVSIFTIKNLRSFALKKMRSFLDSQDLSLNSFI